MVEDTDTRFSKLPGLTQGQKLGCISYSVVGAIIAFCGLIASGYGDCASGTTGATCENVKLAFYPGLLIVVFIGGALLLRKFLKQNG